MERLALAQPALALLAVRREPTRQTPAMRGSSYQEPGMSRLPCTTLTTPAGSPISMKISQMSCMK